MDDAGIAPTRHRLTVNDYHRMGDAGIFAEGARVELIEGDLIDMAPIGQDHAGTVGGLAEALFLACAGRAVVWLQNPVRLDQSSEPQPDIALLRRRADFYKRGEPPAPADILLLVEVADSSLRFDRTVKLRLYARSGIAEYWILDLKRRVVDVHTRPAGDSYGAIATYRPDDRIALVLAPEIIVKLDLAFA